MVEAARQRGLLVFGDDGSPGADIAWLWVCNHRWPGWRADIVTATLPPLRPLPEDEQVDLTEWDSPHRRLLVPQSELTAVRHLTASHDPRILLGDRGDAEVLVVGSSGVGHLRALLVGSTTEWLLHHPPTTLVVVRSATPVRRVLACVDGSVHAQRAVEAFAGLPWATQAEVAVLGVADGRSDIETGQANALETLEAAGITAVAKQARGKPAHRILEWIDDTGAQLVVLGTRGLTGWKRLRLGSTAGAVVRAARCSALVACVDDEPDAEPEGDAPPAT